VALLCLSQQYGVLSVGMGSLAKRCHHFTFAAAPCFAYQHQQLTRLAIERDEDQRTLYQLHMLMYNANELVFVDESAFNRRTTTRQYGWATMGDRARRRDFFVKGVKYVRAKTLNRQYLIVIIRYSMLPALAIDGILHLSVVEGSHNGETFENFVDGLLDKMNPYPNPKSVLVMDNASIHKSDELIDLVRNR
jgi:DDE superfamily endonuclease